MARDGIVQDVKALYLTFERFDDHFLPGRCRLGLLFAEHRGVLDSSTFLLVTDYMPGTYRSIVGLPLELTED